jgi:uncharacterized protein (TIGR03067 family)
MRIRHCANLLVVVPAFALMPAWAGDTDDAAKKELKLFQGSWKAAAVRDFDGSERPEADAQQTRLTVKGNTFTLTGKNVDLKGTFTINPTKTPKTIDVTLDDGQATKILGIYEIKSGVRKSCFALPQKDRPSKFMSENGYLTFEWKRE